MGSRIDDRHIPGTRYCIDSETVFIILYMKIKLRRQHQLSRGIICIHIYIMYEGKVFRTSGLSHQRPSLYTILCVYTSYTQRAPIYIHCTQ